MDQVQKWGVYEVTLHGTSEGNPFVEHSGQGTFTGEHECVTVSGFYDEEGVYRIRFMPSFEGTYRYHVSATFLRDCREGEFTVTPPIDTNHGSVHVRGFHFEYADGTPYFPLETTAYVWHLQGQATQQNTLKELRNGYCRYLLARLSAYRNVWWSLAIEYDLLRHKTVADWERLAEIVLANDPYHHLRSIHKCFTMYDHTRQWDTKCGY